MNHGDVTSAGMRLQVEQAIQSLAPCIRTANLDYESRRQLLQNIREALQLAEVE